ncbi:MAG: sigma-70 family RNA polymerase sigma factor [Candidatus Pacebacteria bacterium]|nr:sigma-70 family RNA polymerase sigma factor [Candidatus Paceibacterota bacterium]
MTRPSQLTDEALVELVRTQDQELYRHLVRRYESKLLRYAERLTGDSALAADVVQQSLIKAYVNLQSFNLKKKFSSWVYRIVHNEAVNQLKAEQRFLSFNLGEWLEELLPAKTDLAADLAKKETAQQLKKCLAQLPLKYRSVLVLFYLEEKSYQEISEVLKIPVSTVGVRLLRGKKQLKKLWQSKIPNTISKND